MGSEKKFSSLDQKDRKYIEYFIVKSLFTA